MNTATRQRIARLHIGVHVALGIAALLCGLSNWQSDDPLRFLSFVAAAVLGSVLKVRLPGVTGAISVGALFVLVGIVNLSVPEALVVGLTSMLVQCTWRTTVRPKPIQVLFNVCVVAMAVYLTALVFTYTRHYFLEPICLALLALTYFCANIFPIASIIGITEGKPIMAVWRSYRWMLAYYVAGASLAWLIGTVPHAIQWELPIICLPLVYLVHRSNRTHLAQIEQEKQHVEDVNALQLRTIEALALAIDAKDHTTHDHLQRVQLYAVEIGKDLDLAEADLDALTAAAVLHDIGKLAVPEYIISKPGKLTRAEFDKMKIHPVVGAEILERVDFPYPVVPIVRAHHEKWDGSGYPYGLKGEDIPIGARILAAVDCLDALASDRQYRRALPLDEAMARVAAEAGTSFDPTVVRALQARYQELEARAKASRPKTQPALSVNIKITRGGAPAAGFEVEAATNSPAVHPVVRALGAIERRPMDMPDTGFGFLRAQEALAVAAVRIQSLVGCDALAIYSCENDLVRPEFVTGEGARLLRSLRVPQGQGLVGWVAEVGRPILNGDPAVEPGLVPDRVAGFSLASALALPLLNSGRVVGVLALYRTEKDAFAADELVSLLELCPRVATIVSELGDETFHGEAPAWTERKHEVTISAHSKTELLLASS
jgi:putative nucleotidyltransferase with HDIG domain